MPHVHKRKTSRGATTDVLERATSEVREGKSIGAAAKDAKIYRMTLTRYTDNKENVPLKKTTRL